MINATSVVAERPSFSKLSIFTCCRRGGRRVSGGETLLTDVGEAEMAIWPFGRRSKKRVDSDNRSTGGSAIKNPEGTVGGPAPEMSGLDSSTAEEKPGRKPSHRRSSRKLTKAPHSKTKDAERMETTQAVPQTFQPTAKRPGVKLASTGADRPAMPSNEESDVPSYYLQNPTSFTSLQPETFTVFPLPPTLRAKKSTNDATFPRRKSSKRKAEDQAREQEIKAMSSPIPIPKRPHSRTAGNIFRDSRKGFHHSTRNSERPLSDVSLPIPESIHSTVSVLSDSHGFRVSTLDALAPRPTIRYFEGSRNKEFGSGTSGPARSSTKRERRTFTPEDGLKPNQRIAYLADELDAGSLRELMDRDQRRSERSRRSEQDKLHKKLQKHADSQQAAKAVGEEGGDGPLKENNLPIAKDDEKNVGQEGSTSPTAASRRKSSFRGHGTTIPDAKSKDSSRQSTRLGNVSNGKGGIESPDERSSEAIIETAKVIRLSQASMSPPLTPKQANQRPSGLSLLADRASRNPSYVQEH